MKRHEPIILLEWLLKNIHFAVLVAKNLATDDVENLGDKAPTWLPR